MDIILMKDSMVISDLLYILKHFNLNFIPFLIVNTVVFYNYYRNCKDLFKTLKKERVFKLSYHNSRAFFCS